MEAIRMLEQTSTRFIIMTKKLTVIIKQIYLKAHVLRLSIMYYDRNNICCDISHISYLTNVFLLKSLFSKKTNHFNDCSCITYANSAMHNDAYLMK